MKRRLLQQCLQIARQKNSIHPEWGNFHHFSFVIQDNKVVEWATNRTGEPLLILGYMPGKKIHAETEAFRRARGILDFKKTFQMVNIRLNKRGQLRSSAPCHICQNFLISVGCKDVWFTTDNGFSKLTMESFNAA